MSEKPERFLVLAVDRDGDLERKAKIRSPVSGRESIMAAATQLAVADPEEADANTLFAAVSEYDKLREQELSVEVGAVCGLEDGGFQADRKIRREVESLLSRQGYTGVVLVTDGAEDEQVIPILQTMLPIVSVRRVVVKHSRTVEENYMVLGRYLRMLVFDPRYSKWAIGVPGIIFIFLGILILLNQATAAFLGVLLIVGAAFLVRGFNIDRFVATVFAQRPYGYLRLFSIPASILILIVGLFSGYSYMSAQAPDLVQEVSNSPSLFFAYGGTLVGYYLSGSLALIWAAVGVYLVGSMLAHLARGSARVWRNVVGVVLLGLLYLPMDQFSAFLISGGTSPTILLITYVLVGLAAAFGLVTTLYTRLRSRPTSQSDSSA